MADVAQLNPEAIDTALPSGSEVCSACGAPLEAHDKFCVACGAANDRVEVLPTKDVDLKKHFRSAIRTMSLSTRRRKQVAKRRSS
jgi:hypothetical protein